MSAWKNEQGEVLFRMHDDNEALGDEDSFMKTKDWEDIEPVWDGMLLLPDITEMKLEEKKAVVRAFLTSHYCLCSGLDKAVMPWSAIIQSQDDFVARKYVLVDVDLKEPSKLQNWDMMALLNFWYAQQETGEGPTFLFKAWKNKDGDMDLLTEAESDPESDTHHMEDDADDDVADGRSPYKRPRRAPGPSSAHEGAAVPCSIPKPRPLKLEAKNMQGKKAVIERLARTSWSKSMQKPLDSIP
ncbi:hypothetical protein EDB19DRAFT_2002207 [Suillus lakei]|nr:hypothetical protein EDB19DRAFT_2002207 [Suillus lakei]